LQQVEPLAILDPVTPIAIQLAALRQARGLSQAALGKRARVRQATISGLETGRIRRVDLDILDRIARALDVEPAALIVRTSARKPGRAS
jgi:transcriptional regulator with XRE-family HTH domain